MAASIPPYYVEPSDIARIAVDAIRTNRCYVFMHDDARTMVTEWLDWVRDALLASS